MDNIVKKPPGMMIWNEDMKLISELPVEQAGKIIKALFSFRMNDELVILDNPLEQAVLNQLIEKACRDEQAYAQRNQSRSEKKKAWWEAQKKSQP